MSTLKAINYVLPFTNATLSFIAIPLIVYHGYKYYLNRDHVIFYKRFAYITIYEVKFAVFKFGFSTIDSILHWFTTNVSPKYAIFEGISLMIASILLCLVQFCWVIRFCLLSYNLNLTNCLLNYQWKRIINPKDTTTDTKLTWYLSKKKKLNNVLFISSIFAPIIIIQIITIIPYILTYSNVIINVLSVMNDIFLPLPNVILVFIYCTIPRATDNFYISGIYIYIFYIYYN